MNNNIRTMKRVRRTHAKFAALNQQDDEDIVGRPDEVEDVHEGVDERPWTVPEGSGGIEIGEGRAGDCLKWMSGKVLEHAGFQGLLLTSGVHHEAENITGTSKVALDVLSSVASEYLLNVGRTMRFLCDMFGQKMSPEVSPLSSSIRSPLLTRVHRKLFCTHYLRVGRQRFKISKDISQMTSFVMDLGLGIWKRNLLGHIAKLYEWLPFLFDVAVN
jgi:hypothetical protein